jgi:electron transfer flavoprotein beta subunit
MRILCVVAQVPGAEERINITDGKVDLAHCKLVMDTMDEYGVEEALRLRESGIEAEIIVVAVGSAKVEEVLRAALALGADRAVQVQSTPKLDPIALSAVVAAVAKDEDASLIFCGGQRADSDSQALGPAIAERLGWPQASWTNALSLEGEVLTGKHDVDLGIESFKLSLPAVVTTQQGLNEPRYPTLPGIMKARKKEIRVEPADKYAVISKLKIAGAEIQVRRRLHKIIQGSEPAAAAAELAQFLRNEAKVIQ